MLDDPVVVTSYIGAAVAIALALINGYTARRVAKINAALNSLSAKNEELKDTVEKLKKIIETLKRDKSMHARRIDELEKEKVRVERRLVFFENENAELREERSALRMEINNILRANAGRHGGGF